MSLICNGNREFAQKSTKVFKSLQKSICIGIPIQMKPRFGSPRSRRAGASRKGANDRASSEKSNAPVLGSPSVKAGKKFPETIVNSP